MIDQLIPLSDRVSASASDWELWPCNTAWVGVESLELSWWDHGAKKKELSEFLCSPVHLFHDESDPPKSKQSSQRRKLSFILYVWISSDPSALLEETDGGSGAKCSPPKDRIPLFWLVCASPHHQTRILLSECWGMRTLRLVLVYSEIVKNFFPLLICCIPFPLSSYRLNF